LTVSSYNFEIDGFIQKKDGFRDGWLSKYLCKVGFKRESINEYRAYMKKAYKDQANSDLHRLSELYLIFVRNTLV
jgi:hypothetical protein